MNDATFKSLKLPRRSQRQIADHEACYMFHNLNLVATLRVSSCVCSLVPRELSIEVHCCAGQQRDLPLRPQKSFYTYCSAFNATSLVRQILDGQISLHHHRGAGYSTEAPLFSWRIKRHSSCGHLGLLHQYGAQEYTIYTVSATYITFMVFSSRCNRLQRLTLMVSLVITVGKKSTHVIIRVIVFTLLHVIVRLCKVALWGWWCLPTFAFSMGRGAVCGRLYWFLLWIWCISLYVTCSSSRFRGPILIGRACP